MPHSKNPLRDSFDLLLSNPSLLVPVFLESFFLFAIFASTLLPLISIAGASFFSNWTVFLSASPAFLSFFLFVFFFDLFLGLLAVSFCNSLFLSMAKQAWGHGFCSLSNAFKRGKRYMRSLFFVNLLFYLLAAILLGASGIFFFSAFASEFPISVPFVFLGLSSFSVFIFFFFSFFWRREAVLVSSGCSSSFRASGSFFANNRLQTFRLWLLFLSLELLAGLLTSGDSFVLISFFLGIFVSSYIRMSKVHVFLDSFQK